MLLPNSINNGDCLQLMDEIKPNSISLVICDLPFGITHNPWDVIIPMHDYIIEEQYRKGTSKQLICDDKQSWLINEYQKGTPYSEAIRKWNFNSREGLWAKYKRVLKPNGAIILFCSGKFVEYLENSAEIPYRYDLIWKKTQPVGFLNANRMPLRAHETMCVFYNKLPTYNPQKTDGHPRKQSSKSAKEKCFHGTNYGNFRNTGYDSTERFPISVWEYPTDKQTEYLHATQKPLALCEELIKTYSNEGDIVLDNCMGSGTTCVAAKRLNRKYIGIEKNKEIFSVAAKRIDNT